jgi:hypothetical protein
LAFAYNILFAALVAGPVVWVSRRAGLPWWAGTLIALFVLAVAWRFFGSQPLGKKQTRYDLEHGVKSLLVLKENGGSLDVRHRTSPFWMQIFRESGDDSKADLVVSIPRVSWAEARLPELHGLFSRQGVAYTAEAGQLAHDSSLVEARVHVPYIWRPEAGAEAARVAHLVLDLYDLQPAELFDFRLEGAPSNRWKQHRDELAQV